MPFRDIVGHRRLLHLLSRAIRDDSLPPSLLFAGPDGVGKRLVAIATAQALNCTARRLSPDSRGASLGPGEALDACGACSACARIARGVHADVLLVEPGELGSIKIDQVREILDRVGYRPFEGRRRVVVIDQADALVPAAQNALLKTLEEPPSLSVFILVTSRPDALLPTVQSRCPRLRFRPLEAGEVATVLVRRGRSEAEARAVAAVAGGSLGTALDAEGENLVAARDAAVSVLAHAAASADPRRRIEGARELLGKTGAGASSDREHLAVHLRAMASLLRDVELLSADRASPDLVNADVKPAIERLTAFRGERGVQAFSAVDRALAAVKGNVGVKVIADWLVLQL